MFFDYSFTFKILSIALYVSVDKRVFEITEPFKLTTLYAEHLHPSYPGLFYYLIARS